jgi:hypothetical protein
MGGFVREGEVSQGREDARGKADGTRSRLEETALMELL